MEIATRTLTRTTPGGDQLVLIRIFAPVEAGQAWECAYAIAWPHGLAKGSASGIDGIQALQLALQKIGIEIYTSEYHRSGQLAWKTPGDGYGFPLSPSMRDLYQGADRLL
ncbi:hypothetical protein E8L99_14320 [Phreatobacter aquaticus]|uniref:DUF6968 domain-containing protein n=1 Tax=Phreatobacter aquaticus TaxID=2570229 RepID=A0A4D7QNI9_9HYPH|nr:hypothetical protein [Phreatobacter aquaticus]QCK86844.1 hypothetical protein E8L99_14320 [Phreatobacter aquaticus]